jgi:hypothetical protein
MKSFITVLVILVLLAMPFNNVTHAETLGIKIFTQWALSNPRDWDLVDTSVWTSLPTKNDPVGDVSLAGLAIGDTLLNNVKGYIFALNVQGVTFNWYDHYAVENTSEAITVTAWRDDPILFPEGQRQVDVGIFKPLKFDPKVSQDNTDQSFIFYREGRQYDNLNGNLPANITLKQYSEFVAPAPSVTKPGIYVSDSKWDQHINAETLKGWRE